MSETEIIKRLQQGDEQAFRQLVENYQKQVVNTCYGLVHSTEDAEDIAQDVFIEVFRSIQNFRADAKLSTWIYRISVNRSLNFIRDNKRRKWSFLFDDAAPAKKTADEQRNTTTGNSGSRTRSQRAGQHFKPGN
jgi:RNA polymerase sigma-70 factor (ECF subfamily)